MLNYLEGDRLGVVLWSITKSAGWWVMGDVMDQSLMGVMGKALGVSGRDRC